MKKLLAAICASAMLVSTAVPAFASSTDPFALTPQADILAQIPDVVPSGQVIYGSTTDLTPDYIDGWTNSATNQDIKILIHGGYGTIEYTKDKGFQINPIVVKSWSNKVNADGTKTYTFEIYDNLVYNDGSPISAKDYLFNILFYSSPAMQELEATAGGVDILVGYDEFLAGETWVFEGMRLINDYSFSLTIKAEEIPNYYEFAYIKADPTPMHVVAPGVDIFNSGNGVAISDNFTTELLMKTVMDPDTGYRYKPLVTCGPYQFYDFEVASKTVTVKANQKFLGNMDGTKPQIETLVIKKVIDATMMDELAAGQVDLLAGVGGGTRIEKGLDLVDEGIADYLTYLRAGYGHLTLHYDFGPGQFTEVHHALAYVLDREEFARQWTQGYGAVVHGYYGISQWEYQLNKDELEARLNPYSKNNDEANRVLDEGGWTLNETGGAYVAGEGKVRHKMVDGQLMPLVLEWLSSENNAVADLIGIMLPDEAAKIGMKINRTVVDFATLLNHYYVVPDVKAAGRQYHLFNLATGFNLTNPVWYYYSTEDEWLGQYNSSRLQDEELYAIALDMKATDPADAESWSKKWVEFQIRINELMPFLPLYSDLYHDFFTPRLTGYETDPMWTYRYAIQRASIQ